MAEQCQNFDTARPRPSSVKIFFSNFDTARPWPSSVKIFFSNFDTARPWPSSVKILTLLGRGRAVSKFFFQILTLLGRGRRCPYARARACLWCLRLLSYEIAARARAFTQWPSAMAVSREVREVKVTTRVLCAHCPSLTRAIN